MRLLAAAPDRAAERDHARSDETVVRYRPSDRRAQACSGLKQILCSNYVQIALSRIEVPTLHAIDMS